MKKASLTHTYEELNNSLKTIVNVVNSGPNEYTIDSIADGTGPSGEITIKQSPIAGGKLAAYVNVTSIVIDVGTEKLITYAFSPVPNMRTARIKSAGSFDQRVFLGCTNLESVIYDRTCAANSGSWMFDGCTSLKFLDYGISSRFGGAAFKKCPLETIILRKTDGCCACDFTGSFPTFDYSPTIDEGGTGCTIYVPAALIDAYKSDTNWAAWDAYGTITWKTIEGSEYE